MQGLNLTGRSNHQLPQSDNKGRLFGNSDAAACVIHSGNSGYYKNTPGVPGRVGPHSASLPQPCSRSPHREGHCRLGWGADLPGHLQNGILAAGGWPGPSPAVLAACLGPGSGRRMGWVAWRGCCRASRAHAA